MLDTTQIVGLLPAPTVEGLHDENVRGIIYLQFGKSYNGEKCLKVLSYSNYNSRKERRAIMLRMRLKYDTFDKSGFHFLIVPDDIDFDE